ncbi:putative GCN1 [Besnoitia besnoiti]|uniref:Putative GCN1 n=1 Tax=Besnoitia besnoiti TaxID=94643 RepID=A0A2A9MR03_BESBE|nr:putative GCN1 [Besnoitia besnoiti]PFH38642.1 putative GCN1 [Besnoitia besnoiti]
MSADTLPEGAHNGVSPSAREGFEGASDPVSMTDALRAASLAARGGTLPGELAASLDVVLALLQSNSAEGDSPEELPAALDAATVKILTSAVGLHIPVTPETAKAASAQLQQILQVVCKALVLEVRAAGCSSGAAASDDVLPTLTAFCLGAQHALKRLKTASATVAAAGVGRYFAVLLDVIQQLSDPEAQLFFQHQACGSVFSAALALLGRALAPDAAAAAEAAIRASGSQDSVTQLEQQMFQPNAGSSNAILRGKAVHLLERLCDISPSVRELLQQDISKGLASPLAEGACGPYVSVFVVGRYLRQTLLSNAAKTRGTANKGGSSAAKHTAADDEKAKLLAAKKAEALEMRQTMLEVYVQAVVEARQPPAALLSAAFRPLLSLVQEGDWATLLPPLQRSLKRTPNAALAAAVSLFSSSSVECSSCLTSVCDQGLLDIVKSSSTTTTETARLQTALQVIGLLAQRCSDTAALVQVVLKRLYEPLKKGSFTKAGERIAFLAALSECLLSPHLRRRFPSELREEWLSDFASGKTSFFLTSLQNELNEEVKVAVCRVVGLLLAVSLPLAPEPDALKPFVAALSKLLSLPGAGTATGKSASSSPRLAAAALEALTVAAVSQRSRVAGLGVLREASAAAAALLPVATTKVGLRPQCLQAWALLSLLEDLRANEEGSAGAAAGDKEATDLVPKNAAQLIVEEDSYLNSLVAMEKAQEAEELRSQLRFFSILCARRPLVLSAVAYGFPHQLSTEPLLLAGSGAGFLNLGDRAQVPFPLESFGPACSLLSGFHFGVVRLLMTVMQRRLQGASAGDEETSASPAPRGTPAASSSLSRPFGATSSFFLSRLQQAVRTVPEFVDLLLLAFYFQLARFSAPVGTPAASRSVAQAAAGNAAPSSSASTSAVGVPPSAAALRSTLRFLLTLRYPQASTAPALAHGGPAAPSPQFNALLLLCLMHPLLLQSRKKSGGHVIRACLVRVQALCGADAAGAGETESKKKKKPGLVAWDTLFGLLPLAAQAGCSTSEATGGYRDALFGLVEGLRGLCLAAKTEERIEKTPPGAASRKKKSCGEVAARDEEDLGGKPSRSGRAEEASTRQSSVPISLLLRGLESAAKAACSQLAGLLGTEEMKAFSEQDVALYFARDDELYREEGTYQAQEVEAKNVKKNKFQSALYGDLADEIQQEPKTRAGAGASKSSAKPTGAAGVHRAGATASARKDARGARPGHGAGGAAAGSGNQTKADLEAEELALQQAQRRRMRASVERTEYALQCLGLLGECMPGAVEALFSVQDEGGKAKAVAEDASQAAGGRHAEGGSVRLQVAFQDLMRSPLVSMEALKTLRRIVNGGLVPQAVVPRRSVLPDALLRVGLSLPLEEADVQLLATIHPKAVLSPAAAALILPVVSAILQNAQSSGLPASQQAMELLRQQLQLRAPLHEREVLGCLSCSLRAHPSLVSTAATALQDFCAYLLARREKKRDDACDAETEEADQTSLLETLLNVAVADDATVRRAVVEALQVAPKDFLKKHLECIAYLLVLQQDVKEGDEDADAKRTQLAASKLLKSVWVQNEVVNKERLGDVGVLLRTPHKGFQLLAAKAFASLVADLGGASQLDVAMSALPQLFSWYLLESYPEGAEKAAARRARRAAEKSGAAAEGAERGARGGDAKPTIAYQKKEAKDPFFVGGKGRKTQGGSPGSPASPQPTADAREGEKNGGGGASPNLKTLEAHGAAARPATRGEEEEQQESLNMKLGVARTLQCLAERRLLAWEEAVQEVLRFLLTSALTTVEAIEDEGLQQALLAAGVAAIQNCATENEEDGGQAVRQELFHVVEKASKKGVSACGAAGEGKKARSVDASEVQAVLNVACSVFFGAIAEKLDGSDPTVKKIIKELIACIVDPRAPSPDVQRTISRALSPLVRLCASGGATPAGEVSESQAFCFSLLSQMLDAALTGDDIVVRRGGARGLGGIVKGLGILTLKTQHVMDALKEAMESKDGVRRQGALLCIEALSDALGRLFEPYTLHTLSLLLSSFSDTAFPVRLAAQQAARQIMAQLSGHGVKLILPTLIEKLEDPQWRTKVGSIELLGAMTHCAPRQLASCLPQVVPLLSEVMSDTCFPKVRESARDALFAIAEVISNPEIKQLAPKLIETLVDPTTENTKRMLEVLLTTSFRNSVDAPSLALVCPIAIRGLRERGSETKHKAANIVGSMVCLATEPKDFLPYLPQILVHLQSTLVDPIPHVRAAAARAFGTIAKGVGEEHLSDVLSWLFRTLKTSESSVERSGAAYGLSEVLVALGPERLKAFLPDILANATDQQAPPDVREGYLGLFVYLPTAFRESFQDYVPEVLPVLLGGLADNAEPVREVSLRACDVCVQQYAQTHTALLLRPLEDGLFSPDWRIRQSSVTLIGTLLDRLLRGCGEGVAAEDVMQTEILSLERRAFILSSLYIIRSDEAAAVRQTAVQVWKSLVSNSPRTLKELLPILTKRLISNLAASSALPGGEEKQRVAARCIGSLAHKLGDAVLPQLLPCLEQSLRSPDASTRRGVCVGLAEVVASAPRATLVEHMSPLLQTVRSALADHDASVQHAASRAAGCLIDGLGSDASDRILPPMLSQLIEPAVYTREQAAKVFTSLREAQLQGFELLLQEQTQAVLPRLLALVGDASRPLDASKLRLLGSCATIQPLERLQRNLKRILQLLLGACCQTALPESADSTLLWTEALAAALRLIKRLDAEGITLLVAVLEEELRNVNPIVELTAHGRQQLLSRSAATAARAAYQNAAGAGKSKRDDDGEDGEEAGAAKTATSTFAPIAATAFLNMKELRAHPDFMKFVETDPLNGRRRRAIGEVFLLLLWSRGVNSMVPFLEHILQLVLPMALADPAEEALVAGGACLAALHVQIRREELLGIIPELHGTVLKFVADPVTGKPVGSQVLVLPGLAISKKEPATFALSPAPLPPAFPPFSSASLLAAEPPNPCPSTFETLALIYQQGLMYGTSTIREASARALQQLVLHASASAVEPMAVKLAGPLIRTVGDKFCGQVKGAILLAIRALLLKAGLSVKPLLPQLQTTLLKCIVDPHPTVRTLGCRIIGTVTSLNVSTRVEGLLGDLVGLIQNAAATGAGALQVSLLQAVSNVLRSLTARCSGATYAKVLDATWEGVRSRQEEEAKVAAGQAISVLLLKHASREDALAFLRDQVLDSGNQFEADSRLAACLVLTPIFRGGRDGWEILKDSDIEDEIFVLIGTLLEDQASAVQRAALDVFRVAAACSRHDQAVARHCFKLVGNAKAAAAAAGVTNTGALLACLRGLRSLAKHSTALLADKRERYLLDTCDLASLYLFHQSPVVKLQAEAVFRYALRVSGSEDGRDEAGIFEALQQLQAGGFDPRRLQQLSEYAKRVLTRTAQSTNQLSDTDDEEEDSQEDLNDFDWMA